MRPPEQRHTRQYNPIFCLTWEGSKVGEAQLSFTITSTQWTTASNEGQGRDMELQQRGVTRRVEGWEIRRKGLLTSTIGIVIVNRLLQLVLKAVYFVRSQG